MVDSPDDGGEQNSPPKYSDIFRKEFPYYLSIGMTPEEYWDGDCELVKYYRKADELRRRERNTELWLQGMYIYEALLDVSPVLRAFVKNPKPQNYSSEPYPLTIAERKAREERDEKKRAEETRNALMEQMLAFNKARSEEQKDG